MSCDFEKIKINDNQEVWLREVYKSFQDFEEVYYREIKARLDDKLPAGFDPTSIDSRLLVGKRWPTPIAIQQIDPDNSYLESIDHIVSSIRKFLSANPRTTRVPADEIAKIAQLDKELIVWLLNYLYRVLRFFPQIKNATAKEDMEVDIDGNTFDLIWNFPGICEYTEQYFSEINEENRLRNTKLIPRPQNYSFGQAFDSTIQVKPIFQSKITYTDKNYCFIIMPFTEDWSNRVYDQLIKKYIDPLGFQCIRADNLHGQIVMDDIWAKINQSAFVIADVTGKNPNVMYELGIVHTVGKPCILITQEIDDIPFDTNYLRHHHYKDEGGGFEELGVKFKDIIKTIYDENYGGIDFPE